MLDKRRPSVSERGTPVGVRTRVTAGCNGSPRHRGASHGIRDCTHWKVVRLKKQRASLLRLALHNAMPGRVFTNVRRTASAVSEVRPYAPCMELEVRPASEVERFVAFARANGCQCRVLFSGRPHRLTFDVPLARDPTEARRIALDVITSFSAENTRADVRVTRYD